MDCKKILSYFGLYVIFWPIVQIFYKRNGGVGFRWVYLFEN